MKIVDTIFQWFSPNEDIPQNKGVGDPPNQMQEFGLPTKGGKPVHSNTVLKNAEVIMGEGRLPPVLRKQVQRALNRDGKFNKSPDITIALLKRFAGKQKENKIP